MIVSHVKLQNWRNFRKVDVSLGDRVFLVGPNASGKSNFLDVFRFLGDIAQPGGGLQSAVNAPARGGLSKIRSLAARRNPNVEIRLELSNGESSGPVWTYEIGIRQEPRGRRLPLLSYERVWRRERKVLDRPDQNDRADPLRLSQTHLEQVSSNQRFREVAEFFTQVRYLHLIPQLLRRPDQFRGIDMPNDPFGLKFLERIAREPEKTRKSRLTKIEKALRTAVPQLLNLSFVQDELGVPHLEAMYKHWRPGAGKQREEQFSDGTLRMIALLWVLLDGDSLLLLEEPEISLHAAIVEKLPGIIARLQGKRRRQILISTHSYDLLADGGIGGEEVLLLIPEREGTAIQSAASIREIRELLEAGIPVSEAILPWTQPKGLSQLSFFE